jgi:GT2 family glycosyltransferase
MCESLNGSTDSQQSAGPARPLVTVVVAVKDDFPRLPGLLESVMGIAMSATEIIVVDGSSSDGTRERRLWDDNAGPVSVRWLSEPDDGVAEAWNRGVALARGEWVVFLGEDDVIHDNAAWQHTVNVLRGLPLSCGIAVFPIAVVSPAGRLLATETSPAGPLAARLLAGERIAHQGMFHRQALWTTCGQFDMSYRIAADYEFCLRACRAGVSVESFPDTPAVAMTFGGMSKQSPLATLRELRRAQRFHDIPVSSGMLWAAWLRAGLRWCGMQLLAPSVVARCADAARQSRGLPPVWTVP